ncbi:MAG: DUF1189 family protein [Desulfobaccales bacterium]
MKVLIEAIQRISAVGALLIVLGCGALSSWGLVTRGLPALATSMSQLAAKYDAVFPEITFRDGKPSIREKPPYFVHAFDLKNLALVIDNRETRLASLMNDLSNVKHGAVLARETLVVKIGGQTRILPLPQIPDMVLNSRIIEQFIRERFPQVTKYLTVLIVLYGIAVKLLQILILGFAFYYASRLCSVSLTYGESFKVASVTMILLVLLNFFLDVNRL